MPNTEQLRAQIQLYSNFIFDMDGTLMNSEIWHHESWNQMVGEFGIPRLSTELLWSYGGMPTIEISRDICRRFNSDADPVAMSARKTELYRDVYMMRAEPFPMICDLLKELKASGKRIAIATSSHQEEAQFLLGKNSLLPYIDALVTGDMVTRGKPNPDIYLLAAEKLQGKIDDCLVFEDTVIGMQGVHNAKMAAVKVFDGAFDCDHVINPDEVWQPQAK